MTKTYLKILYNFFQEKFPRSIKRKRYTDDDDWVNGGGHSSGSDDEFITIKSQKYKRPKLDSGNGNYTPNLDSYKEAKVIDVSEYAPECECFKGNPGREPYVGPYYTHLGVGKLNALKNYDQFCSKY